MKTELIKIFVSSLQYLSGAPNDGFLLNSLKTLFSLSRVLLDIQKCILSGTINLYPFGHPRGNSSLFEISRNSILFSRKCFKHFKHFITKMRIFLIPLAITFLWPERGLGFVFSKKNSLNWGVKCMKFKLQKIVGNLLELASKTVHEWNDHVEIISSPQVIENSGQYLLLRTDILQKTVVGCPWFKFSHKI